MHNLSRVQNLSRWIHSFLAICIAIIPVYYVSYWFLLNQYPLMSVSSSPVVIAPHQLPIEIQAVGFLSSLLPLSALIYILSNLRKIFSFYKDGIVFSFEHVVLFKKTSKFLIVWVPLSIVYESVKSVLFSWSNSIGERVLSIGFGSEELTVVTVAIFIYVISWVMDEGRKLTEEHQMTI